MTLISSIITDAFREANIFPLGKVLTANQEAEALRLLNGLFSAVFGSEAGEGLTDWPLGKFGVESPADLPNYYLDRPTINRRLIAVNEEPKTVYLTAYPQDGSRMGIADPFGRLAAFPVTLDANGRTIENLSTLLLNLNGLNRQWFYRADLGGWTRLTSKIATEEMPFPAEHDNFFIILLAMRLNPRYGRQMDPQSAMIFKSSRRDFVARYLQSQPLEINDDLSWPFMSTQGYDQERAFSSNRAFNRGGYGGP